MKTRRRLLVLAWSGFMIMLAGCATPIPIPRPTSTDSSQWHGRLSIQVESNPSQRMTAAFTLQGNSQIGSLSLASPLGTTIANLQWEAGSAHLQANGESREFNSLNALVQNVTGTDLPVESLFLWLQGIPATTLGWHADLTGLKEGRFSAQRSTPYTPAMLKIILDR